MELSDVEFLATYNQHKEYLDSLVHADHMREIRAWIEDIHARLIAESDPAEIFRFQGRAQALTEVLAMAEKLLQALALQLGIEEPESGD